MLHLHADLRHLPGAFLHAFLYHGTTPGTIFEYRSQFTDIMLLVTFSALSERLAVVKQNITEMREGGAIHNAGCLVSKLCENIWVIVCDLDILKVKLYIFAGFPEGNSVM